MQTIEVRGKVAVFGLALAWIVWAGGLLLWPALVSAEQVSVHQVISSENDERQYRYLVLPNKLRVLLVSDRDTDKAAASMDVNIGSNDDPEQREGLAHFLEHMLFLGTEKYPDADDYQSFISSHGGSHNAYTSDEHTNYFFDVEHLHLEQALDRFAEFFVAPLFTPEYVDRERNAVHSEFRAKFRDDYRRQLDVYRQIVRPQHPLAKFSVGNLDTLADREGNPVRQDLLKFYEDYYSSTNMTLVVLGRESLDQLQALVVQRFTRVPERHVRESIQSQHLFAKDTLPQRLRVQPLQDMRRLTLSFPVPNSGQVYWKKPLQYLGGILGHEGEGSLLSALKQLGWAEALSAGGDASGRNQSTFDISIQLTEEGYRENAKVVAMTLKMIELLGDDGIDRWRYREQAKLAEMAMRFAEEREPIHTVSRLSSQMHEYKPEDVIRGPYAFDDFDAGLIKSYLRSLSWGNLLWVLTAPEVETSQVSPLYQAPYALEKAGGELPQLSSEQINMLGLPQKNSFVPGRLKVKDIPEQSPEQSGSEPILISSSEYIDLWFRQDDVFRLPKADMRIRVYSALLGQTAREAAMSHLYAALVSDALNEFAYPARLAGLSFNVRANSRGFDIVLSGYNARQGLLLSRILDVIHHSRFEVERFASLKQEMIRRWRNQTRRTPYEQLFRKLPVLLYAPLWDELEMAAALEAVSLDELNRLVANLWLDSRIQMLVHGNFFRQEAIQFGAIVEKRLYREPETLPLPIRRASVTDLPAGLQHFHLQTDHHDVAAALYLQAQGDRARDRAAMLMIRQMLSSSFFHQLRTEKQLGYVVFLSDYELKDVAANVFVVQSPSAPLKVVMKEIEEFIKAAAGKVEDMELHRQAVLAELTEKPKNMRQQTERYWSEIVAESPDFTRRKALVEALKALTAEELAEYSRLVLSRPEGMWLTASPTETVAGQKAVQLQAPKFDFDRVKRDARAFIYR